MMAASYGDCIACCFPYPMIGSGQQPEIDFVIGDNAF